MSFNRIKRLLASGFDLLSKDFDETHFISLGNHDVAEANVFFQEFKKFYDNMTLTNAGKKTFNKKMGFVIN